MSAIEHEYEWAISRFYNGQFQFQKAPGVVAAYYYLILFNEQLNK